MHLILGVFGKSLGVINNINWSKLLSCEKDNVDAMRLARLLSISGTWYNEFAFHLNLLGIMA